MGCGVSKPGDGGSPGPMKKDVHGSVSIGDTEALRSLIEAGADVHCVNSFGVCFSPLVRLKN
jgi:hypothetical protein